MKSNRTQKDIDQFFESFKQLPEYYPLEKVHQFINASDPQIPKSAKLNFKPLKFIIMISVITVSLLTFLVWSPLLNNNIKETKIAPTKNNTYISTADSAEKKHKSEPTFNKPITGKNPSSGQKQAPSRKNNPLDLREKPIVSSNVNQDEHKNSTAVGNQSSEGDTLTLLDTHKSEGINAGKSAGDKNNLKQKAAKAHPENLLAGINFIELSRKELLNIGFTIQEDEMSYTIISENGIVLLELSIETQGVSLWDSLINESSHRVVFLSTIDGRQYIKWKAADEDKDKWDESYFQEKIQFLIPIVLRKNAYPDILHQDHVFWFEPTEAFLNNLPKEISTSLKREYNYLTASKADVKVKSNESCTYFEACRSSLPLNNLKLYPNPAHNTATIKFHALKDFTGTISLLNISGDLVRELIPGTTFPSNYTNTYKLDLSGISPGMYLVSIITDEGFKTQRLIVQ